MNCRACGAAGVPLTLVHKPDATGALVPISGVCAGCSAPKPAGVSMPARVFTAIRPGVCHSCGYAIVPGEKLARQGDARVVHAECVQER